VYKRQVYVCVRKQDEKTWEFFTYSIVADGVCKRLFLVIVDFNLNLSRLQSYKYFLKPQTFMRKNFTQSIKKHKSPVCDDGAAKEIME